LKTSPWSSTVLAILAVSLNLPFAARAEEPFVPGKVEVLIGAAGERLTLIFAKPMDKNQVLIKFENTGGEWDGRVTLHEVKDLGHGKSDYVVGTWTTVTIRGSGYQSIEVFVQGVQGSFRAKYDKDAPAKVNAQAIVDEYEKLPRR
jgi:hypothetical protein